MKSERLTRRSLAATDRERPTGDGGSADRVQHGLRALLRVDPADLPSISTVGVPVTPSFDIWSVALTTHCWNVRSSIGPRTSASSAPASTAYSTSWSSVRPALPSAGWFSNSRRW